MKEMNKFQKEFKIRVAQEMTLGASVLCWLLIPLSVVHGGIGTVVDSFIEHQKFDHKDEATYSRPNIVLIMADDMAWGDVGANWPETLETPNLDKMARQGLRMTDFHSGVSVCTPSRATLLTGRLGLRTGVVKNFDPYSVGGIPTNETTIQEILREAGYRTAMFGKWHLGTTAGHHPIDKGFTSYLGVPYSLDMGCADIPGANLPQCRPCQHDNSVTDECAAGVNCQYQKIALPLYANRTVRHQPVDMTSLAAKYAAFARNFILESRHSPFFLYAALSHIHVPLAHAAMYTNVTGRGVFADTLYEMDWLVGEILEAARAAGDNTLVWFMSDNGPWEVKCQLAGSPGPYTGSWQRTAGGGGSASKTTVWEAGHRVPSIVRWPGRIKAGSVSTALVSALDVLPTLVSLTNSTLPLHRHLDGMDVSDILTGRSQKAHQVLFHPNCDAGPDGEIGAVRVGKYKAVLYTGGVPDCSGTIAPLVHHTSPLIFNLAVDPRESSPLDPKQEQYQDVLRVTSQALADLLQDIRGDNTSTVDYSTSSDPKPCCDKNSDICRCAWD